MGVTQHLRHLNSSRWFFCIISHRLFDVTTFNRCNLRAGDTPTEKQGENVTKMTIENRKPHKPHSMSS